MASSSESIQWDPRRFMNDYGVLDTIRLAGSVFTGAEAGATRLVPTAEHKLRSSSTSSRGPTRRAGPRRPTLPIPNTSCKNVIMVALLNWVCPADLWLVIRPGSPRRARFARQLHQRERLLGYDGTRS